MKQVALVVVLAFCTLSARAGETVFAKYAGEFLSIGVGGRALAMGGASVALANDVTAGYWNPAGLARIEYPEMILMHNEQFAGLVNNDYGAVAIPLGADASLALSVIRVGVDDIPNTQQAGIDANGNQITDPGLQGTFVRVDPDRVTYFSAADWAFYLTYAKKQAEDFTYGANVKLIRRSLGSDGATGIGFDVGAWYTPVERLQLGANIQDVTTTLLAWNTGRNELIAPTMKLGAAYFIDALGGRFAPAMDFDLRFEGRKYAAMAHVGPVSIDVHSGLEYVFKGLVALRAGYSDVKQLTVGAGLHLPKLDIDYSFAKFDNIGELGNSHRISLMFTLEADQFKRPAP